MHVSYISGVDKQAASRASLMRNLVDVSEQLRREIAVMALNQLPRSCHHCRDLKRTLRSEYNSKIFFVSKTTAVQRLKPKKTKNDLGMQR